MLLIFFQHSSSWCSHNLAPFKNNRLYGANYPVNMPSQCIIYTMCIKGRFRSAKCLNNSIHANKERSERSKERMGGGRELAADPESQIWWWCYIFSSHYTVLLQSQSPLYAGRAWGGKNEEKGVIAQRARGGAKIKPKFQNIAKTHTLYSVYVQRVLYL